MADVPPTTQEKIGTKEDGTMSIKKNPEPRRGEVLSQECERMENRRAKKGYQKGIQNI